MKDNIRTLWFAGIAVVSVALAWFVTAGTKPAEAEAYAKVGTEFYPEFKDPTLARSLEITGYDTLSGQTQKFVLEYDRGRWRIPSHHGYPADAKDHLEKAAASLIGITRAAVAGRLANAHKRFGVIEPPDSTDTDSADAEPLEGIGQRIVLKDEDGNILADYILGKRVADQNNVYFVRLPNENETYHAEIDLDVSTKFGDWVEKDLLKLNRDALLSIEYSSIEELRQVESSKGRPLVVPVKNTTLVHRPDTSPGTKWEVDDLDAEKEEVNTTGVSTIQTALDSLELNGVRQKLKGLTPRLTVDEKLFPKDKNPADYFLTLRKELASRGFMMAPPIEDKSEAEFVLFGQGGELIAKTNEGLVYHLLLGSEFLGTAQDIEVGKTEVADAKGDDVADPDTHEETRKPKQTLNRFLFIRVEFDESLLGKAPEEPKEPQKPEGLKDEAPPAEGPKDDAKKEKTPEELKQEQLRRDYEGQLALYKSQKAVYEEDKKEFEDKRKAGKAKETELNNRFGEWYYVIPATSYDNLNFTRADIVQAKSAKPPMDSESPLTGNKPSALDDFLNGKGPAKTPATPSKPAVAEKPAQAPAKAEDPARPE